MYYILLADRQTRDGLIAVLKQNSIHAVFHYVPLHSSPVGRKYGYASGDLPVTEELSERLVRLPFFYEITAEQQATVVEQIDRYLNAPSRLKRAA